ncbi:MarR family winged helix-turn-helix transcriptional regulator [Pseudoxanthomonas japonensis]|nr:MarR family winged helix-turn-helix transcriptional regulator [Pseudoxanthomonas japonensis]
MTLRAALGLLHAKFGERPSRQLAGLPKPVRESLEREVGRSAFADRIDGIFALERRLRRVVDHQLSRAGLTYAEYAVLRFIREPRDEQGFKTQLPVGPKQIEKYFDLTKRTVAVTLGQLRNKGMLIEERGTDGRRVELHIHPEKLKLLSEADLIVSHVGQALGETGSRQQDYASWFLIPRMLKNLDRFR